MRNRNSKRIDGALNFSIFLIFLVTFAIIALIVLAAVKYFPMLFEEVDKLAYPLKYEYEISAASEEFSVPKETICAVIYAESSFDKDARSSAGALGLMQIMPSTFKDIQKALKTDYTEDDLFDPAVNIRAGTYYLSYLYRQLGDWETVHAAYNAGIGKVWNWLEDERYSEDGKLTYIPYGETKNYVKKIETAKEKYASLYFEK